MRHIVRWPLLTLAPLIAPGIATARATVVVAERPPATAAVVRDYRVRSSEQVDQTRRAAAMPDRLFDPAGAPGLSQRRHDVAFTFGGIEMRAEVLRERTPVATGDRGWAMHAVDRRSVAGIKAGWPLANGDSLSLGIAANLTKRPAPSVLAGRRSMGGSGVAAGCTWLRGAHLQMSLDWRADRSRSRGGVNRLVELAQGAAFNERGLQLTLSYVVTRAQTSPSTMFGIAARDARIAADDLETIGAANRRDTQTALFLRTAF